MRRVLGGGEAEASDGLGWVDERIRLSDKHKSARQKPRSSTSADVRTVLLVAAGCWLVGLHQLVFAWFTRVECMPATVLAGENVTCTITTAALSGEAALSVTQTFSAGPLSMVSAAAHSYRVTFATRLDGFAGVRVRHALFATGSEVEVVAGPAVPGSVEVRCVPERVVRGGVVSCAVTPRDAQGNPQFDVVRPADAEPEYFSVAPVGSAHNLTVHRTAVSFLAGRPRRAGIAVTLGGIRAESRVEVIEGTFG